MTAIDQPTQTRYAVVMDVYDVIAYTKHLADEGDDEGAQKVWEEGGGEDQVIVCDTAAEAEHEAWTAKPIPGVRLRVDEIEVAG